MHRGEMSVSMRLKTEERGVHEEMSVQVICGGEMKCQG